jgi:hypothetical protein
MDVQDIQIANSLLGKTPNRKKKNRVYYPELTEVCLEAVMRVLHTVWSWLAMAAQALNYLSVSDRNVLPPMKKSDPVLTVYKTHSRIKFEIARNGLWELWVTPEEHCLED